MEARDPFFPVQGRGLRGSRVDHREVEYPIPSVNTILRDAGIRSGGEQALQHGQITMMSLPHPTRERNGNEEENEMKGRCGTASQRHILSTAH